MAQDEPRDLLIECASCGIENIFSEYTPDQPTFCNQCRDRLIHPDFNETHNEYRCEDCGFSVCLLKETEFDEGNTPCRCGSTNVFKVEPSTIAEDAEEAGAFELEEENDASEEFDWYRSDSGNMDTMDDYNELFDQDPGAN
jgi:DNA-directed RNA polymerase subunit RPC12/RpoP